MVVKIPPRGDILSATILDEQHLDENLGFNTPTNNPVKVMMGLGRITKSNLKTADRKGNVVLSKELKGLLGIHGIANDVSKHSGQVYKRGLILRFPRKRLKSILEELKAKELEVFYRDTIIGSTALENYNDPGTGIGPSPKKDNGEPGTGIGPSPKKDNGEPGTGIGPSYTVKN